MNQSEATYAEAGRVMPTSTPVGLQCQPVRHNGHRNYFEKCNMKMTTSPSTIFTCCPSGYTCAYSSKRVEGYDFECQPESLIDGTNYCKAKTWLNKAKCPSAAPAKLDAAVAAETRTLAPAAVAAAPASPPPTLTAAASFVIAFPGRFKQPAALLADLGLPRARQLIPLNVSSSHQAECANTSRGVLSLRRTLRRGRPSWPRISPPASSRTTSA